jgi:phospholipid/cholesterol/gamma-HCH transport system substrate-binding protein
VLAESQSSIPVPTGAVLGGLNDLLRSVPQADLRTTVDELGKAFDGSGKTIATLLDSANQLTEAATASLEETRALVDDLPSVLSTQQDLDPSIRSYASSLERLTAQLEQSDGDLRGLLATGSPALKEFSELATGLRRVAPDLFRDLETGGEVLNVYRPALEHILTIVPPITATIIAATDPNQDVAASGRTELNLYFKANAGDPPPCIEGFEDAHHERSPYSDIGPAPIPSNSYCKVAPDDPRVVRGARNQPCPNERGRRGPTAASCGLVFDPTAVSAAWDLAGSAAGGSLAELLVPDGRLFLTDARRDAGGPLTWQQLLIGLGR